MTLINLITLITPITLIMSGDQENRICGLEAQVKKHKSIKEERNSLRMLNDQLQKEASKYKSLSFVWCLSKLCFVAGLPYYKHTCMIVT